CPQGARLGAQGLARGRAKDDDRVVPGSLKRSGEKRKRPLQGVRDRVAMLGVAVSKEPVRRSRIGLDRKVFPGALQTALELRDLVGGDSLVRATEDTQQCGLDLTHDIQRCGSRWFGFQEAV